MKTAILLETIIRDGLHIVSGEVVSIVEEVEPYDRILYFIRPENLQFNLPWSSKNQWVTFCFCVRRESLYIFNPDVPYDGPDRQWILDRYINKNVFLLGYKYTVLNDEYPYIKLSLTGNIDDKPIDCLQSKNLYWGYVAFVRGLLEGQIILENPL